MINDFSIQDYIPYYLTQEAKKGLIEALKDFPEKTNYYTELYPNEILQGDGFYSLDVIRFEDGKRDEIKGILLSNSCDIDEKNRRELPIKISFAPLIRLNDYIALLQRQGFNEHSIDSKVRAIKEQKVSYMFYLPKNENFDDEHIALFSDLHTIPLSALKSKGKPKKLFTLSQVGFYIFLFKISIHFCRFHEGIER